MFQEKQQLTIFRNIDFKFKSLSKLILNLQNHFNTILLLDRKLLDKQI
jgi:hypothetical protein